MEKIKVLIIDDSAVVRQTLSKLLSADPKIEVVGTAADPYIAVTKIKTEQPDVITLDIEMPKMDGLTFLKKLMLQHPMPVVVVSSSTEHGSRNAIQAMEYGAVEVIAKPKINTEELWECSKTMLCEKVVAAAMAKIKRHVLTSNFVKSPIVEPIKDTLPSELLNNPIIVIGASTGGPSAIAEILIDMPEDCPGIVIAQHMPELFTKQFANRLNGLCKISVEEASNNTPIVRGKALIAPGGLQTTIRKIKGEFFTAVAEDTEEKRRHKPSVDVLFLSAAEQLGANAIGVLLTGMGADGANGLLELKKAGAYTIVQDEQSCTVFGMPKEAIKIDAAMEVLPLPLIAKSLINKINKFKI